MAALADLVDLGIPVRICYATRDSTAEWEPVVDRARALGVETVAFDADHFFVGRGGAVGEAVAAFFSAQLGGSVDAD